MGPSACLDETTVLAFLGGDLAAPERSAVESHLASCSSCTDPLTWAAADHADRGPAPGNEGRPYPRQISDIPKRVEALRLMGRHTAACRDYETSSRILRAQLGPGHQDLAYPLQGMGENLLSAGDPSAAIPFLEEALAIRTRGEPHLTLVADTRFALSRALWQSVRDRPRAQSLAVLAAKTYASGDQPAKQNAVTAWLSAHGGRSR